MEGSVLLAGKVIHERREIHQVHPAVEVEVAGMTTIGTPNYDCVSHVRCSKMSDVLRSEVCLDSI